MSESVIHSLFGRVFQGLVIYQMFKMLLLGEVSSFGEGMHNVKYTGLQIRV